MFARARSKSAAPSAARRVVDPLCRSLLFSLFIQGIFEEVFRRRLGGATTRQSTAAPFPGGRPITAPHGHAHAKTGTWARPGTCTRTRKKHRQNVGGSDPHGKRGRTRTHTQEPKSAPERPKSDPRAAKSGPRAAQERPKSGPRAAKSDQERPKSGQERPKAEPELRRWTQERPRRAQDGSGPPQGRPEAPPAPPRTPPKCTPRGSKIALRALKFPPRIPRRIVCIPKETPRVPEQSEKTAALHTR